MDVLTKTATQIMAEKIFRKGDTVIIGLSGGSDSMTLLDILYRLRHEWGLNLVVAHFNHNCRSGNRTDEQFSRKQSENYGLPFYSQKWDTAPSLKRGGRDSDGSWENLARQARTAFFKMIAQKHQTRIIALAHTLDDVAETVLMRILRGSGLRGLRSIQYRSYREGLVWVRPLIYTSKQDCLKYLSKHHIAYRTDPTNAQNRFFRNRVRNEIIPFLEKTCHTPIKKHLVSLAELATADYACLEELAVKKLKTLVVKNNAPLQIVLNRPRLQRLAPALQNLTIQLVISQLQDNLFPQIRNKEFTRIIHDLNNSLKNTSLLLPHQIQITFDSELMTFTRIRNVKL